MAGSITKQFDFIINSATHAVSKKCDLKLLRSTSFNYFVAESITTWGCKQSLQQQTDAAFTRVF
jgi:hypothetical protein